MDHVLENKFMDSMARFRSAYDEKENMLRVL